MEALTAKDKVESGQQAYPTHHASQALCHDAQAHTDDQEQEEAQRVSSGVKDRYDEQKGEGRGATAVLVDETVVGKVGEHLDDEEDDGAGNVVLHGSASRKGRYQRGRKGKEERQGNRSQELVPVLEA